MKGKAHYTSYKVKVENATKENVQRALEIIGGTAERYASEACPVDTGTLQRSITHQPLQWNEMVVGTNVEYAPYVELGTRKMKAQPYLRPAVENHRDEYEKILKTECSEA